MTAENTPTTPVVPKKAPRHPMIKSPKETFGNGEKKEEVEEKDNSKKKKKLPPPQPKHRRVATIASSAALVLDVLAHQITIWSIHHGGLQHFNRAEDHLQSYRVGAWVLIGIWPNGKVAWLSPETLSINVHPTKVEKGRVMVQATTSIEATETHIRSNEWGLVRVDSDTMKQFVKEAKENTPIWIRWIREIDCKEGGQKYNWEMVEMNMNELASSRKPEGDEFEEHEYRQCMETIRNRTEILRNETKRIVVEDDEVLRHHGVITYVSSCKQSLSIWSPGTGCDGDHPGNVTIPNNPFVGQWIWFDTGSSESSRFQWHQNGQRVRITENFPINAPEGMSLFVIGNSARVVLTKVLINGTDNPLVFELPDFGFAIDRKQELRTGAEMQIVLERCSQKIRRLYGISWKVVESAFIKDSKTGVSKTASISAIRVHKEEALELSLPVDTSQKSYICTRADNHYHQRHHQHHQHQNGGQWHQSNPNQHHQRFDSQQNEQQRSGGQVQNQKTGGNHNQHESNGGTTSGNGNGNGGGAPYARTSNRRYNNFHHNTYSQPPVKIVEYDALVEKMIDAAPVDKAIVYIFSTGTNLYVPLSLFPNLKVGDSFRGTFSMHVNTDASGNVKGGCRMILQKVFMHRTALYNHAVDKGRIVVYDEVQFTGEYDYLDRAMVKNKLFGTVIDQYYSVNVLVPKGISILSPIVLQAALIRKRIPKIDPKTGVEAELFSWIVRNITSFQKYPDYPRQSANHGHPPPPHFLVQQVQQPHSTHLPLQVLKAHANARETNNLIKSAGSAAKSEETATAKENVSIVSS